MSDQPTNDLSNELNSGLTVQIKEKICSVFSHYPQIKQAILYGSRAKGTFHQGSDIDLSLKGDINLKTLNSISLELDDLLLPYDIDLSVFDLINNPELKAHIERVGIIFY